MRLTISIVEGLQEIAVQMFILETLGNLGILVVMTVPPLTIPSHFQSASAIRFATTRVDI